MRASFNSYFGIGARRVKNYDHVAANIQGLLVWRWEVCPSDCAGLLLVIAFERQRPRIEIME